MVYLDNLAPSGRRSMSSLLQRAGRLLDWSGTVEDMPWLSLRYQQVMKLRAALLQTDLSINTANTTLAAIRGVLKVGFLSRVIFPPLNGNVFKPFTVCEAKPYLPVVN